MQAELNQNVVQQEQIEEDTEEDTEELNDLIQMINYRPQAYQHFENDYSSNDDEDNQNNSVLTSNFDYELINNLNNAEEYESFIEHIPDEDEYDNSNYFLNYNCGYCSDEIENIYPDTNAEELIEEEIKDNSSEIANKEVKLQVETTEPVSFWSSLASCITKLFNN